MAKSSNRIDIITRLQHTIPGNLHVIRDSLLRHAGWISAIVLSVILTLFALVWLGFDLRYLSTAFIGDEFDTLFDSWAIYQAMQNLLNNPGQLGYAPIYYGDANPFAYTIAPYGIAVVTLPLYLITGRNLELTYNLYLISTFASTSLMLYLLSRYLLNAPQSVGVLIGLMGAFSQYRFLHLSHPAELSLAYFLLTLYMLHRLLDWPRYRWVVGLAIASWLTITTSGYLGMMALTCCAIIVLFAALKNSETLSKRLARRLVLAAIVAVVLSLPFVLVRLGNTTFVSGHNLSEVVRHSASPGGWITSVAQIYIDVTPHQGEGTLFPGFVSLILAVAAFWHRNKGTGSEHEAKLFKPAQVVTLYSIIALAGYVLSLGPILKVGDQTVAPLPYLILMQLPGFSSLRAAARFIVMALAGIMMLSVYALTLLHTRTHIWVFRLILIVVAVFAFIESIPFNGSKDNNLRWAASYPLENRVLSPNPRQKDIPAYDWLADQPARTPIFQYPVDISPPAGGNPLNPSAMFQYAADLPLHNQPMLNGHSSITPEWYTTSDWGAFPEIEHISLLESRDIRYILVHHEFLTDGESIEFESRLNAYEALWGAIPAVERFDEIAVYQVHMPQLTRYATDFDETTPGDGWYGPEQTQDGITYQWTDEAARLTLPLVAEDDLYIEIRIVRSIMPDEAGYPILTVNGQELEWEEIVSDGDIVQLTSVIPLSLIEPSPGLTEIMFSAPNPFSPGNEGSTDIRVLGIPFEWLQIAPLAGSP